MNRILFEKDEIVNGIATFGGERAEHVLNVLHGEVGQVLKTGEINGPIGTSEIISVNNGEADTPVDTAFGSSPCRARVIPCPLLKVRCNHTENPLRPWVDLILAPPRPRVMKRMLPQLASLGVGRIFLVGAKKVEKDFWGATLLKSENSRPLLIDGLMQAGTSVLPTLETRRSFRKFVREELDALFPCSRRIVAHPYGVDPAPSCSLIPDPCSLLLAIGPEGGWTDDEVALLEERGFARYSLGARILRTDTATVALLAQLMKEFGQC